MTGGPGGGSRRGGRPRSASADAAIAEGVIRLLQEGAAAGELSMERIARTAGVGKATLYRRWPDKDALLLDVLRTLEEPLPAPGGASVREDLVALLASAGRQGGGRPAALLRSLLGQRESRPLVWRAYREAVLDRRREAVCAVLRRGMGTGEVRADADVGLLADLFTGPLLARALLGEVGPDDAESLPERVVDLVLEGVRPPRG